jgi:Holliday junction resolvase-like predicted endonuclease
MNFEIRILERNSHKKGRYWEDIVRNILETQRYDIDQNVNFTGREIDLIATHKDRKNETAFVECKAVQNLESNQIHIFCSKTLFQNATYGYFISTTPFQHQVSGLIQELTQRYQNLYFFGPDKMAELLAEKNFIKEYTETRYQEYEISKKILVIDSLSKFYLLLLRKGSTPEYYTLLDASDLSPVDKPIEDWAIEDIQDLQFKKYNNTIADITDSPVASPSIHNPMKQCITEIESSREYLDYLPTSSKHIVVRKNQRKKLMDFFQQISDGETNIRSFYIKAKSGYGKSSLLADLRERCRNKHYKNKLYTVVIDSRNVDSVNFLSESIKYLVNKASKDSFIPFSEISITSHYEVLGDKKLQESLQQLKSEKKLLIIVFDQFEDIFRKKDIFIYFHKLLLDVSQLESSLVIGFSWKSEITIDAENETYSLFTQAAEKSTCISLPEFSSSEINKVISFLEKDLRIKQSLKEQIMISAQGFPWLIKKLCIYIKKQRTKNIPTEISHLKEIFEDDLEGLGSAEKKALTEIARRADTGDFFDTEEVDDNISSQIISTLIDRRLVIKTGSKHNIYWDVFRNYLNGADISEIGGNAFIIRTSFDICLKIFNCFKQKEEELSLEDIQSRLDKQIQTTTIQNSVYDLISLDILEKKITEGTYRVLIELNEESLKEYIKNKLSNHKFYKRLTTNNSGNEFQSIPHEIMKQCFKWTNFKDQTWKTYSNTFMNWLKKSDLKIFNEDKHYNNPNRNKHYRGKGYMPQISAQQIWDAVKDPSNRKKRNKHGLQKLNYDLKVLGLLTNFNREVSIDFSQFKEQTIKTEIINQAYKIYKESSNDRRDFNQHASHYVSHIESALYKNQCLAKLRSWGKLLNNNN